MTESVTEPMPRKVPHVDAPLVPPAASGGLMEVFRRRYLLRLLVRKEIKARYQGSLLGLLWSYVQPLVRFVMYFFVIGLVLGMHRNVPNFAIHMFSAIVFVQYFTETFSNGTRAIVQNKQIVRKMAMPRELFPVASAMVSAIHIFAQLLILLVGCLATGWSPDWQGIYAGLLGAAILVVFGTALALLFSALNVFFRDFQNIVATLMFFTHWAVPMLYPYGRLATSTIAENHPWFIPLYLSDPLAVAVLLEQRCFWIPTWAKHPDQVGWPTMPNHYFLLGWVMLGVSIAILVICQLAFRRLENQIAERV